LSGSIMIMSRRGLFFNKNAAKYSTGSLGLQHGAKYVGTIFLAYPGHCCLTCAPLFNYLIFEAICCTYHFLTEV
jgi:hypothetical protein